MTKEMAPVQNTGFEIMEGVSQAYGSNCGVIKVSF